MKSNNIIQEKSFAFAIRIVNLNKHLISEKKEFVLAKQLLRSGTSIGANVEEAIGGVSDKDPDNSKGKKTDKKAEGLTDKVQAGTGNLDLVPYRGGLQGINKEEAGKMIRDAAKKVRQSAGGDSSK